MNLALLLSLAILLLFAFSVGVNLGIHGIITVGAPDKINLPPNHRNLVPDELVSVAQMTPVLAGGSPDSSSSSLVVAPKIEEQQQPTITALATIAATTASLPPAVVPPVEVTPETVPSAAIVSLDGGAKTSLSALNEIYRNERLQTAITTTANDLANRPEGKGPIEKFLEAGGKIPIVLLTCNRPDQLTNTLKSLLAVRGVTKDQILVSQDGAMQEVADVVRKHGIKLQQNTEGLRLRGGAAGDGAERIAKHYKYSLTAAFDAFKTPEEAPAIIVVEDDLLFSPDFYEYLVSTAPVLEKDPTTFVVSAWNDNGFKGRVGDPYALKRTEYFPGLGWLLPRVLYKQELESRWPLVHWDHWLRSIEVHGTREIVYPEVPRTFHNGIVGTFMDLHTHNRYFRDIDYNIDGGVEWDTLTGVRKHKSFLSGAINLGWRKRSTTTTTTSAAAAKSAESAPATSILSPKSVGLLPLPAGTPNYLTAVRVVYEARLGQLIQHCTHLKAPQELFTAPPGVVCIWMDIDPTEPDGMLGRKPEFEPLSMFLGIWHEHRRGAHKGVHELFYEDKYVLILNVRDRPGEYDNYKSKMPPNVALLDPRRFDKSAVLSEKKRKKMGLVGTAATAAGMNCDDVCQKKGMTCRKDLLPLLNTCQALNELFPCRDCVKSIGSDQPAYVSPTAPATHGPGKCVVSSMPEQSTCGASHESTLRLCACA